MSAEETRGMQCDLLPLVVHEHPWDFAASEKARRFRPFLSHQPPPGTTLTARSIILTEAMACIRIATLLLITGAELAALGCSWISLAPPGRCHCLQLAH